MVEGITTNQVKRVPNPTGKGGFGDHPESRNPGGWKATETFKYWFDSFKVMSVDELKRWQIDNPEDVRSVASDLAFTRIINSKKDLNEFKEVANRSEGGYIQPIEHSGNIGFLTYEQALSLLEGKNADPESIPEPPEST